jgi:hypothetical protein
MRASLLLSAALLASCASTRPPAATATPAATSGTPAAVTAAEVRSTALGTVTVRDSTYQCPNAPPNVGTAGNLYFGYQVERQASALGARPTPTLAASRSGQRARVDVMFVISESGRVEMPTVKLVASTDTLDTQAVCEVLPRLLFRPASLRGRAVRMWDEEVFTF